MSALSYAELRDFIQAGMKMSHIYQPLLIRALMDADGTATMRQLAIAFAAND
jgi:ATP adenylyltransferase